MASDGPIGPNAPVHGGNLSEAVRLFGHAREHWLDLSTGINPHPYPVPALEPDAWHRLPDAAANIALAQAAQSYYQAPRLLPVAGTQAAIQALPHCRMKIAGIANVAVAAPTYAEHAYRWGAAGHRIIPCTSIDDLNAAAASPAVDVMVICNPNNPTGMLFEPAQLLAWHAQLAARGGWLVVDEAFGDTVPQNSIAASTGRPGLIVLKSVGKFFGLAGLRLGFVAAENSLLAMLDALLGPWSVSGPALMIGTAALSDGDWQRGMRDRLVAEGTDLSDLLQRYGVENHGTALYRWSAMPALRAEAFWRHMAHRAIWVRLFAGAPSDSEAAAGHASGVQSGVQSGVRLGLPADEHGWQRLDDALVAWRVGTATA